MLGFYTNFVFNFHCLLICSRFVVDVRIQAQACFWFCVIRDFCRIPLVLEKVSKKCFWTKKDSLERETLTTLTPFEPLSTRIVSGSKNRSAKQSCPWPICLCVCLQLSWLQCQWHPKEWILRLAGNCTQTNSQIYIIPIWWFHGYHYAINSVSLPVVLRVSSEWVRIIVQFTYVWRVLCLESQWGVKKIKRIRERLC